MEELKVIETKNQRVLLTSQLAESYETDAKIISNNFKRNEIRFTEGKHYFYLKGNDLKEFKANHHLDDNLKYAPYLYLWTESGALRHAKILDTEKAWEVFEILEETYFKVKQSQINSANLSPELQAIIMLDQKQTQLDDRLNNLEDNMTIDYGQERNIEQLAKRRILEFIGGTTSPAYRDKSLRSKAFSAIWRDYKDYFRVASYRNTPKKDYEKAINFLSKWQMAGKLLREIENCNSQVSYV